ncbi:MAG: YtxH domain-containing protein [Aestuariibaculum sp.]
MSDEKNLGNNLDEQLNKAKEEVKKAADKVEDFVDETKEKAKDFTEESKEKANDFVEDAKEAANDFKEDVKDVATDGKNIAIIAHLTWVGWIVGLVMNNSNKTEIGSFYVRQMLGFLLLGFLIPVPFLGWALGLVLLVAWIMSFLSALQGQMKPSFLLGKQFQEWFKSL